MDKILNVGIMLDRLKKHFNFKTDTELAKKLGMNLSTLSSWKGRNTFDINEIFSFCVTHGINFQWLLTGEVNYNSSSGDKYSVSEDIQKYEVKIYELEKELKKTDAECDSDNKECSRLNAEITALRAKLEFANTMIDKLIKQH